MRRREALALAGLGAMALANGGRPARAQAKQLRIGYQKYGTLVLLKEHGSLEKRLQPGGYEVTWTEFPAGPQLLEALNVGAIDFGTTGEAPPIFAQAAGAALVYVGYEPPAPKGEAIIVPADSPLTKVADLKGRKVALNKGSNVHFLLVRALEASGLSLKEIEPVYLPPADARAAFERGAVDAWVIWDPFLAAAQAATGARTLADGEGLVDNHQFFLASQDLTAGDPQAVRTILEELDGADRWAQGNQAEVAKLLGPRVGIPAKVLAVALARIGYGVAPVTPDVIAKQQKIADTFHQIGLLPKAIRVEDAAWRPSA
jgi:sulfonate transport system substrate-binding protein